MELLALVEGVGQLAPGIQQASEGISAASSKTYRNCQECSNCKAGNNGEEPESVCRWS